MKPTALNVTHLLIALCLTLTPAGALAQQQQQQREQPSVLEADQLLPLERRSRVFNIIDGQGRGEQVQLTLQPATGDVEGQDVWQMQLGDMNTAYLRRHAQGQLVLTRLDLPKEGYSIQYDPALPLMPARIGPDEERAWRAQAIIYELPSGERYATGTVRHTLQSVSRSNFDTAAGQYTGYFLQYQHNLHLPNADLRLSMDMGTVPGEGLVYRRMAYTLEKIGLFGESQHRTISLGEPLNAQRQR